MSGISGITGAGASYYTQQIASGKRINSAADDAAGLTISESLKSETGARDAATENIQSGISALNIADGALGSINDYLQRIKELSVKASNGLLTKADKQAIQNEINQNIKGIDEIASSTQYNTLNLLDGSNENITIASNPDGTGPSIGAAKSTSEALGLKGYNVTGDFDMSIIDKAIDTVNANRSQVGADTNALEYAYSYGQNSIEQLNSANSRIEDADIAKAISEQKKASLLEQYRLMAQKKKSEEDSIVSKMLF